IPIQPAYEIDAKLEFPTAASKYTRHIQPTRKVKGVQEPTPIAYEVGLSPIDAKPGDKVTLFVRATLTEGWHTFSLTQKDQGGSPTVIEMTRLIGLKSLDAEFHADQSFEVKVDDGNTLEIYHDVVTWARAFEVLPGGKPGQYGLFG